MESLVKNTLLYVVDKCDPHPSVSKLTFGGLADAFVGGLKSQDVAIFFDMRNATEYVRSLQLRYQVASVISEFSEDQLRKTVDWVTNLQATQHLGKIKTLAVIWYTSEQDEPSNPFILHLEVTDDTQAAVAEALLAYAREDEDCEQHDFKVVDSNWGQWVISDGETFLIASE